MMSEAPFRPREKLIKHQQFFQNISKHTYLKGRYDVITSVAIPLALAVSSGALILVESSTCPMELARKLEKESDSLFSE